ncbi:MAG: hypothetical protein JSR37_01025 [Verrucomicrobia bacterium]|nr:hypothetical protein [Verrucomicrobiota bacterium]
MKKISLICLFSSSLFLLEASRAGPGPGARGSARPAARAPQNRAPTRAPNRASGPIHTPAARPNPNINRTPAMSRPPVNRPIETQRPAAQPIQARPRPTIANQAQVRNEIREFRQQNVPQRIQRPQNFGTTVQSKTENARQVSRLADNSIRGRYPEANRWFKDRFFETHPTYDFFCHPGVNWWRAAGWASVANWLPYGWYEPYYYTTGYEYVPMESQYQTPVDSIIATEHGEWMPLGVFAAGVSEKDAAFSNFFLQLALDKSGNIAGTFYNAALDQTQALAGTVDPKTQQAIWKVSDSPTSPTMVTGLYNLTQDATDVEVYFGDEAQTWTLLRIDGGQ